jgi:pimeloyl-ACP methyl ester carboxylesterase
LENSRTPAATYPIKPKKPVVEPYGETIRNPRGSFVLMHGWNSVGSDMAPLSDALKLLPTAVGWNFYTPTYETHSETFVEAARDLYQQIQALTHPLILLGYSEGGIVARQLIADGVQIKALVTICAPHLGLGAWIPTPDPGSASISPFSSDLQNLNNSPVDQTNRKFYHLFAISCTDFWGYHDDDGVVRVASALGHTLGAMADQKVIHLDYGGQIAGVDPHHRGMDPTNLQPVLDTCSQLL